MKKILREKYLQLRLEVSMQRREEAKRNVLKELKALTACYQNILSYYPLSNEVCINEFNRYLEENSRLYLPKIEGQTLVPYEVSDMEQQLKAFSHKFLEPKVSCKKAEKIDAVIIPGIVFDRTGARVGFGKGYYDRYLGGKDLFTIGVCFKEQIYDQEIILENHDVKMERLCIV